MSPSIKRLDYRNKRKTAFRCLPFVGDGFDYWDVPAIGGYDGGRVTGDALAAMMLKSFREDAYWGTLRGMEGRSSFADTPCELAWIVESIIQRAGGQIERGTVAGDSFAGQLMGFFGTIQLMLQHAATSSGASRLDRLFPCDLIDRANAGLKLDSEPVPAKAKPKRRRKQQAPTPAAV